MTNSVSHVGTQNVDKKRILFFCESLKCGGAEKSLLSLLLSLDYSKVDVDLMLVEQGGLFQKYLPSEVKVVSFPKPKGIEKIWNKICISAFSLSIRIFPSLRHRHGAEARWMFDGGSLPKLTKQYDVAIAYQQGMPTYYIAERVSARSKIAWVNIDLKGAGYKEGFNRKFYDKFDKIVAVSDKLYQDLIKHSYLPHDRLTVIYDMLNERQIREMSLADVSMPETICGVKIVTVGRIVKQKNYPLAVETARILRERGVDFSWTFVGDGSELPNVKKLIDDYGLGKYIFVVGEQPNPYPFMRNADIYVHTASFEGYGLTLSEARILGKPVVSTDFTVVHDQIKDGINGLIADMTPESIADKIIKLIKGPKLKDKIVLNISKEHNTTSETEINKFYNLIELSKPHQSL